MTLGDLFNRDQDINSGLYFQNFAPLFDAFSRLRTSDPTNRSDIEFIYGKQPLLMDDISTGSGSATHRVNTRDVILATGGTTSGDIGGMRQHYWTPYTPGNGQLFEITGVMDYAAIGGGTMQVFLRSSITGSKVDTKVNLADWDISQIRDISSFNWSLAHIFVVDFQSLKVGQIRFALNRRGKLLPLHTIYNDNLRNSGYWQMASLPPCWKIYNDGSNTAVEFYYGDEKNGVGFRYQFSGLKSTATATAICSTVKSEGGATIQDLPGLPLAASNELVNHTVSTTLIPILAIRPRTTFNSLENRAVYIPTGFSISTNNPIQYKILLRPTLTGASWSNVDTTYSGVEKDVTASAISGGIVIASDYLTTGNNQRTATTGVLGRIIMALGNSNPDILAVAAIKDAGNDATVKATINWKEIR